MTETTGTPGHGFFPGRASIEAYGDGGFRFAGMSHRGSLFFLPSAVRAWGATGDAPLHPHDFEPVFEETERLEFFLVGTGKDIRPLSEAIRMRFRERGIQVDAMSTGAAVRTFNVMLAEDRRVGCALLAVD
jgi:uncharacterized protein